MRYVRDEWLRDECRMEYLYKHVFIVLLALELKYTHVTNLKPGFGDLEEMLRIYPILDYPAAAVEELRGLKEELKTLAGNMGKKLAENMMSQQRVSVIVFFPLPDMQVFLRQGEELMSKICRLTRGMRGQERA